MKISIVTVNFNNLKGLRKTVNSALNQNYKKIEVVIIDGNSQDGSVEFLNTISDERVKYISEKDDGIYDAMNKGIRNSTGDWIIFMNSGDIFYSSLVLSEVSKCDSFNNNTMRVLYGNKFYNNEHIKPSKLKHEILNGGMFACHQSMFFRNDINYNTEYRIYGDYDLLARIYKKHKEDVFSYLPITICNREDGGVSSVISFTKRKEKYKSVYLNFGLKALLKSIKYRFIK